MVSKAAPARRRPRADGKVDQVISEPGKFIGDLTGRVLFTAGEVGPEGLTITPLTKNRVKGNAAAPASAYDGGGDVAFDIDARDKYRDDIRDKMPFFPSPIIPGLDPDEMRELFDLQRAAWERRRRLNDYGPPTSEGATPLPLWRPSDRRRDPFPGAVPENLWPSYNHNENPEQIHYRTGGDVMVRPRHAAAPRPRRYDNGGDLAFDPNLLNDPDLASKVASGAIQFNPDSNTIGPNLGSFANGVAVSPTTGAPLAAPAPAAPPQQQPAFAPAATSPAAPYGAAGTAQWAASNNLLSAEQQGLGADQNVLAARTVENNAKRTALGATSAYLDTQGSDNATSRAEEIARQAAENNVEDKTAIAQAQRVRDNSDSLFGAYGLSKPIDVTLPAGATTNPASPGIRAALRTQEDIVTGQNKDAAALRGFNTEDSRISAARANQAASAAGLDVNTQQIASDQAALGVKAAGLAVDKSKQPPTPGMVFDPYSGDFVSKDQFDAIQADHGVTYDAVNKAYVSNADLHARTDSSGNILRTSDNTWVNPKNGNELRNGVWTDPKTGNTFDATIGAQGGWVDRFGNHFVLTGPSGQGYWVNPQGFRLGDDGIWRDPVSGAQLIDGVIYSPTQLSAMHRAGGDDGSGAVASSSGSSSGGGGGSKSSSSSGGSSTVVPSSSFGSSAAPTTQKPAAAPPVAAPSKPSGGGSALSNAEKKYQLPGLSSFIP